MSNKIAEIMTILKSRQDAMLMGGAERVMLIGNLYTFQGSTKIHQRGCIYSAEGLCPAICATDYKGPTLAFIRTKQHETC